MALFDTPMMWDGQGPVFLGKYDPQNGKADMGFLVDVYQIGCGTNQFTTTPNIETESVKETCTGARGDLSTRISARSLTANLGMYQFSGRTLAAALYGNATDVQSGTVTAEPVGKAELGGFIFTRYPHIKNLVVRDDKDTQLTAGTHYQLEDAATGRIRIIALPGGATAIKEMDYEYDPHVQFSIFSTGMVERGIIFSGINSAGQRARVTIPKVNFAMGGDFAWIGDENASLELQGTVAFSQELQFHPQFTGGFGRVELMPGTP